MSATTKTATSCRQEVRTKFSFDETTGYWESEDPQASFSFQRYFSDHDEEELFTLEITSEGQWLGEVMVDPQTGSFEAPDDYDAREKSELLELARLAIDGEDLLAHYNQAILETHAERIEEAKEAVREKLELIRETEEDLKRWREEFKDEERSLLALQKKYDKARDQGPVLIQPMAVTEVLGLT